MKRFMIILCLSFVFSSGISLAAEKGERIVAHLNNVSDYPLSYLGYAIDDEGNFDCSYPMYKSDIRVGEQITVDSWSYSRWRFVFFTEKDEMVKEANMRLGAEIVEKGFKAAVMMYCGGKNYDMNREAYLREYVPKEIPKNPNPWVGALNFIDGFGFGMHVGMAALNFYRKSTAEVIIAPKVLPKDAIGVRIEIANLDSNWQSGIQAQMIAIKPGARKGIVRSEVKVSDLYK